jgi:hypothetical protein
MCATLKKWLIATRLSLLTVSAEIVGICLAAQAGAEANAANVTPARFPTPIIAERTDADISHAVQTDYTCEFGVNFTVYKIDSDDSHIFVRWETGIHRLEKVMTTTGAGRFENEAVGLTWISIPTKVILLDSKLHRQLANECKSADYIAPTPDMKKDIVPLAPTPFSGPD